MEKDQTSYALQLLQAPVGAVKQSIGTVVAGVGTILPATAKHVRPQGLDPSSDEAFEGYKAYHVEVERDANRTRYYASIFDRISSSLLIGAFAGVGVTITGALATALIPAVGAAAPMFGAIAGGLILVGLALAAGFLGLMAKQGVTQSQAGKEMDVSDFRIRRQAALIAKEISKELRDETRVSASAYQESSQEPLVAVSAGVEDAPIRQRKDGRTWQQVVSDYEAKPGISIH